MNCLLEEIIAAARQAGGIMMSAQEHHEAAQNKTGHANFVTEYDQKVQELLMQRLSAILPEAHFVGEENGKEVFLPEYAKGYTFVVDPIDGTTNFMKAYRPSCTSIGLLKDGKPYIGVIYVPYTDQMFHAERGKGAFENGRCIRTSGESLKNSLVTMGTAPYYGEKVTRSALDIGHWYLMRSIDIRRTGSAAFDLCMVASGRSGLFFEPRLGLWDYAAAACILLEAGGKITDIYGKELTYTGASSVCAASEGIVGESYLPPRELIYTGMDPEDECFEKFRFWCKDPCFDQETKQELKAIEGNAEEIEDRFYRDLEFGTGGLRGVIGAGTNRMNIYTVRKATQGLANFIIKEKAEDRGVAIAYDSRIKSDVFARETALCLAANGIKAYIYPSLRPTPMLSYAVRELGCIAGVVVTASHNPAEYNGYKVYWEDGAQITAPKDKQIIAEVNAIDDFGACRTTSLEEAEKAGLYEVIGPEMDDHYMADLKKLVLHPEIIEKQAKNLTIVYTPLHGTGNLPVRRILKELGFEKVYVVEEQEMPDGHFPTVPYPNPEDKKAFALALELAEKVDADIVLATDPDADRLGIYAKDHKDGTYKSFTGNMSGMIILEYLLSQRKKLGLLPEDSAVVTTIVSGKMARKITGEYHVALLETLTGFKYIGEQIKFFERDRNHTFIFGYEESYGCLEGTHARDKDAVVAVMALCEAAAFYKEQGLTLCDQMRNLFEKYGFYKEDLCTVTLKGQDGARKIKAMMEKIRSQVPERLGSFKVLSFRDYRADTVKNLETGEVTSTGLPSSNVLYFELENDAWCCARPSGTEPKIKFYVGVCGNDEEDAKQKLEELMNAVRSLAE